MKSWIWGVVSVMAFMLPLQSVQAAKYNDAVALEGVQEVKVIYDMRKANPKAMLLYLQLLEDEHESFKAQNIKASERMIFIADAVKFITTQPSVEVDMEYGDILPLIHQQIEKLISLGFEMEVCAIATAVYGVDDATLVPGMKLVRSGFMSLIGWQQKGYTLVPIYN